MPIWTSPASCINTLQYPLNIESSLMEQGDAPSENTLSVITIKFRLRFNMLNYQKTVQNFDLNTVAGQFLSGSMQAVNACYECCDRHADSDQIALVW